MLPQLLIEVLATCTSPRGLSHRASLVCVRVSVSVCVLCCLCVLCCAAVCCGLLAVRCRALVLLLLLPPLLVLSCCAVLCCVVVSVPCGRGGQDAFASPVRHRRPVVLLC